MKKLLLSVAVISAMGLSAVANAAPTVGASGTITFNGTISADSCVVHSNGPGTAGGNLTYNLGTVPVSALGTEANPGAGGTLTALPTDLNLSVECGSAATTVELKLTPTAVSGKGIAVSGGATNVQIMLVDTRSTTPAALDFTSGSATLAGAISGGSSSIPLKAYYTHTATGTATAGPANATVAYTLSYN
jgi:major type 1 subunit fimbrin (pilin)